MNSTFTPALLVVDMQYDFVYGSLAVPNGNTIIDIVNSLLDYPFVAKIASKDFHPPGHVSFAETHQKPVFSRVTIYPPGDTHKERPLEQVLWPVHCVANTPGSEFVEGLKHEALTHVIYKGTDQDIETYSAFRDPWHLSNTELPAILKSHGVTDVFLVGLAGDYCVKSTAFDAVDFGYKTWVVRDAVKSVQDAGTEWEEMQRKGIQVVDYAEVKRLFESA
ncbi:Isochorismatase-like protein [Lyophyllum atratum]|nr:Isochorismatase-like protein [Lyophyllum atratum]